MFPSSLFIAFQLHGQIFVQEETNGDRGGYKGHKQKSNIGNLTQDFIIMSGFSFGVTIVGNIRW